MDSVTLLLYINNVVVVKARHLHDIVRIKSRDSQEKTLEDKSHHFTAAKQQFYATKIKMCLTPKHLKS